MQATFPDMTNAAPREVAPDRTVRGRLAHAGRVARTSLLASALLVGFAPAASAHEPHRYHSHDHGWERSAPFDGCGRRARSHGWCHGERIRPERRAEPERYREKKRTAKKRSKKKDRNDDVAIALGIAGVAAGALVLGAIASENRNRRDPRLNGAELIAGPDGQRYPSAPGIDTYPEPPSRGTFVPERSQALEPWSDAWLRACDARYRSFNPSTGTFRGYDGQDHFCVPG